MRRSACSLRSETGTLCFRKKRGDQRDEKTVVHGTLHTHDGLLPTHQQPEQPATRGTARTGPVATLRRRLLLRHRIWLPHGRTKVLETDSSVILPATLLCSARSCFVRRRHCRVCRQGEKMFSARAGARASEQSVPVL